MEPHLSEVVESLIAAGLTVEFLHEFPFSICRSFPFLERSADGFWRAPGGGGSRAAPLLDQGSQAACLTFKPRRTILSKWSIGEAPDCRPACC